MIGRDPDDPARGAPPEQAGVERPAAAAALAREIAFRLEVARSLGWSVPLGRAPATRRAPAAAPPRAAPAADRAALALERERRGELLSQIDAEVRDCRQCALCRERTRTVFGTGDPCARLLFVGEGPGYDEDRLGEPFVGKAGQLLDRMIAAMGLTRGDVYIANIVKCRPPGNRAPEGVECAACLPFLRRQIDIIRPEVICTLGNTPTRALLGSTQSITRVRGTWLDFEGTAALPTFHPAYLLRNPAHKKLAWEDLQAILRRLGLPVPQAAPRPAPEPRQSM